MRDLQTCNERLVCPRNAETKCSEGVFPGELHFNLARPRNVENQHGLGAFSLLFWSSRTGDGTVNTGHFNLRIGGSAFMDFAGAR